MVASNRYPLYAVLSGKGILGPSIGDNGRKVGDLSGGSVSARFAASNGVLVEGGKFKCPPGTPGAGDFTDALGSTCGVPSQAKSFNGEILEKVGLAGSRSKPLQALQGIGSLAVPGDMSDVRSPVRSTLWEIITPGGGKDRDRRRRPKIGKGQDRCPPGFEFGGRFTNARLSTCGTRLFDLPSLRGAAADILKMGKGPRADETLKGRAVTSNVTPNTASGRRPEIPAVGAVNIGEINSSVANNIPLVATDTSGTPRLVRRDGTVLSSMVSIEKLASTKNNADIADGVIIRRATDPSKIGDSEVGLLAAGARSAVMVFPDGSSLTLSRTSKATPESVRGMNRRWSALRRNEPDLGYGSALEKLVSESDGKLELKPEIRNVKGPLQLIQVEREDGSRRMVRRWIFEIFLSTTAPSRPENSKPWTAVPSAKALPQSKKKAT
jgi:hypothetical protein